MADDAVVERLDLLISTIKLAFSREIDAARERIRSDTVSAGILNATAEATVRSGDLQKTVAASARVDQRTARGGFKSWLRSARSSSSVLGRPLRTATRA
jgi:hypothetical protein